MQSDTSRRRIYAGAARRHRRKSEPRCMRGCARGRARRRLRYKVGAAQEAAGSQPDLLGQVRERGGGGGTEALADEEQRHHNRPHRPRVAAVPPALPVVGARSEHGKDLGGALGCRPRRRRTAPRARLGEQTWKGAYRSSCGVVSLTSAHVSATSAPRQHRATCTPRGADLEKAMGGGQFDFNHMQAGLVCARACYSCLAAPTSSHSPRLTSSTHLPLPRGHSPRLTRNTHLPLPRAT